MEVTKEVKCFLFIKITLITASMRLKHLVQVLASSLLIIFDSHVEAVLEVRVEDCQ